MAEVSIMGPIKQLSPGVWVRFPLWQRKKNTSNVLGVIFGLDMRRWLSFVYMRDSKGVCSSV